MESTTPPYKAEMFFIEKTSLGSQVASGTNCDIFQLDGTGTTPAPIVKIRRTPEGKTLNRQILIEGQLLQTTRIPIFASDSLNSNKIEHYGLWGKGRDKKYSYVLMDRIKGVSLDKLIEKQENREKPFNTEFCSSLGYLICTALQKMNSLKTDLNENGSEGIVHRNLNPKHVMLCYDGSIKFLSLGNAAPVFSKDYPFDKNISDYERNFTSPKVDSLENHTDPYADYFSLGIILYTLSTLQLPFNNFLDDIDRLDQKQSGTLDTCNIDPVTSELISGCIACETQTQITELSEQFKKAVCSIKKTDDTPESALNVIRTYLELEHPPEVEYIPDKPSFNPIKKFTETVVGTFNKLVSNWTKPENIAEPPYGPSPEPVPATEDNLQRIAQILQKSSGGKWRVIKKLGQGGMAEVYECYNVKLERTEAVKFPITRDEKALSRFFSEAKILAKFNDKKIVQIHDLVEDNDTPFIRMEFVDGISLEDFIKSETNITLAQAIHLATQILEALDYMHNTTVFVGEKPFDGIIHRDIKPANIMITHHKKQIKLMDFGIAKPHKIDSLLTGPNEYVGSLYYMAPEQFDENGVINATTDIYAFGVTFYEMLTGKQLFNNFKDILKDKCSRADELINSKALKIPNVIQKILIKCIELEQPERYQNCKELISDLKRIKLSTKIRNRPLQIQIADTNEEIVQDGIEDDKAHLESIRSTAPLVEQSPVEKTFVEKSDLFPQTPDQKIDSSGNYSIPPKTHRESEQKEQAVNRPQSPSATPRPKYKKKISRRRVIVFFGSIVCSIGFVLYILFLWNNPPASIDTVQSVNVTKQATSQLTIIPAPTGELPHWFEAMKNRCKEKKRQ